MPRRFKSLLFFICFGAIDCVVGLIFLISRFEQIGLLKTVSAVFSMIALISSVLFFFIGYKNSYSRLYRITFIAYALSELFLTGTYVHSRILPELGVMTKTLTFFFIMVVGFSHDIGKVRSYIVLILNFIFELILLYISYVKLPIIYSEQNLLNTTTLIENASQLILASITIMMVFAKYSRKKISTEIN